MSNIFNYFPGTNTAFGFKSFYKNIISKNEANKIIYLKGGPGTGKSTMMTNVGEHFAKIGNNIEYHHCSSDMQSLDSVVVKELGFCIMDATAPHTMDPRYPGVFEEIINLGECWDSHKLRENGSVITAMADEISSKFKAAYSHFHSANYFWEKIKDLNSEDRDLLKFNELLNCIDSDILSGFSYGVARERQIFVTSITYEKVKTYIEEKIVDFDKVYVLNGEPGEGKEDILDYIHKRLLLKDVFMEVYLNPLNPNFIEHIVLPDLKVAFVSENEFNNLKFEGNNLLKTSVQNSTSQDPNAMELYHANFYEFLKLAEEELMKSAQLHHDLEKIYIKTMDFDKIDRINDEILKLALS